MEIGDEVEVIRAAPIGRGSLLSLHAGDRGVVEGVSGSYCRIRVAGYALLVRDADVAVVRRADVKGRRRI